MISGWKSTRELTRDVNAASDSNMNDLFQAKTTNKAPFLVAMFHPQKTDLRLFGGTLLRRPRAGGAYLSILYMYICYIMLYMYI